MNGTAGAPRMTRRAMIGGLAAVATPSAEALAQPSADPWQRWSSHDDGSATAIDHAIWAAFLDRYAASDAYGVVRLPYARIAGEDRRALESYIAALESSPVSSLRRAEQLAYWVNLYNALTVRIVLDHYPVKSIRDIRLGGGLTAAFFGGPWDAKLLRIENERVSLNDIEHRILRPLWRDARLHYVVNCASTSCPALPVRPISHAAADDAMDRAARAYVNGAYGVRRQGDSLWVSSIYRWYRGDFGGSDATIVAHLARYATGELAAVLARGPRIVNDFYDWSLNDRS
ncbi:MAG: DUF547 domain-containing protein [Alphaproteobacteria bacterium]|nr:DUF547 domain-containing protein [Alphaproteobacteria bacterium]MCW5742752.1 DUF547 domain-containing protein [Alphaproteobacteria bacterium]